ncbi:ATP-grasp domain-containing protein [Marinococcus halophilus]|uniref:ATP-grasp domain-containing protein n=1 Tax=Marinococcus halophilus TaxID=1371 RepID=UPI0009A6B8AA|nr:ATP-grasp domain-containing protein [Marinococcus halophilus]
MNVLLTSAARRIDFVQFFQDSINGLNIEGSIIATDPDPGAPGLQQADRSYITPHQTDQNYLNAVLSICENEKIKMLIPLNDWEIAKFAEARHEFEKLGVRVFTPDASTVQAMRDKHQYRELLGRFGVAAPVSYLTVEEAAQGVEDQEVNWPLIVKPRNGSASVGINTVSSVEDMRFAYKQAVDAIKDSPIADDSGRSPEDNIVIQQVVDGEKYSVDVVNDLEGNYLTTLVLKQLEMRGGDVDKAVSVKDEELLEVGRKIGENLQHVGYINTDVFYDGHDYYVIDINPRFGGGYALSHAAGANIPSAYLALAAGKDLYPEWLNDKANIELARYDRVVKIDKDKGIPATPDERSSTV